MMTAKVICPRALMALVVVITSIAITATAQAISRKLSEDEVTQALTIAKAVRSKHQKPYTRYPVPKTETYALGGADRWYNRLSFSDARYEPIGMIFIVPLVEKPPFGKLGLPDQLTIGHCTAFYVAKDILATAAHCLREGGVTPESKNVILFRQQYDGTAPYTDDLANKLERVVVDWMYPAAYNKKEGDAWNHWSGFDYAFLRTNKASYEDAAYNLAEPDPYLAKQMEVAGYPAEYAEYFEPVSIKCKLLQGTATEVLQDPGVVFSMQDDATVPDKINGATTVRPKKQKHMKDIVDNQLFCLGTKGNMGDGGSGGPWILSDAAIKGDSEKGTKLRTVVGVQSWSFPRLGAVVGPDFDQNYAKGFKRSQKYARASVAAWIKPETMFIYNAIKESKSSESLVEAVAESVKKETKLVKVAEQVKKLLKL